MKTITIGNTQLSVKDYECSNDGTYLSKERLRLWLYVNLTDDCPAGCPFCAHSSPKTSRSTGFDPLCFERTLEQIVPWVSGVSITGGEPMLDIPLLEQTIAVIHRHISPEIELDMVTNGFNLQSLPKLKGIERFATIHVSRHAPSDDTNRDLMNWPAAPSAEELRTVFAELKDPGVTVLNCVLQKNGVHDLASAKEYLEFASGIGAANVSFIGMFMANDYCQQNYVSPASLSFDTDVRFSIWNHFRDHDFCQCSSGDYHARDGWIRYYYRCPGNQIAPRYCRQLVYGADNVLRAGFGNAA